MRITHAKVSAIPDDPDAEAAGEVLPSDWNDGHVIVLVDGDIPASIARDTEVTAAVAAEATLARNADNLASGTVADARIASTIARDSEVTSAIAAEATARDTAIGVHSADTTAVHGIADTANVVLTNDARLSDARTPAAHKASHEDGGTDEIDLTGLTGTPAALTTHAAAGDPHPGYLTPAEGDAAYDAAGAAAAAVATAAADVDAHEGAANPHPGYLTPAEGDAAYDAIGAAAAVTTTSIGAVPTARTITAGTGLTGGGDLSANRTLAPDFGSGAGKVTQGNDSRLSDARTPTAHATSHKAGGSDDLSGVQNGFAPLSSGLLVPVAYLGSGTPNGLKFLRDDGVFAVPASGAAGALVLLEQHTASASATLDFTSFISSTYDEYMAEFLSVIPVTNAVTLAMRMGTGGGPTYDTGANYGWSTFIYRAAATATTGIEGGNTSIGLNYTNNQANTAAWGMSGSIKMFNLGSSSLYKRTEGSLSGFDGSQRVRDMVQGSYESTTAVTAVRFFFSSGNIASGTIRIYGIAKT